MEPFLGDNTSTGYGYLKIGLTAQAPYNLFTTPGSGFLKKGPAPGYGCPTIQQTSEQMISMSVWVLSYGVIVLRYNGMRARGRAVSYGIKSYTYIQKYFLKRTTEAIKKILHMILYTYFTILVNRKLFLN